MSQQTKCIAASVPAPPRDRLASELAAMNLLHDISTRFVQEGNTKSLFRQIVLAALLDAGVRAVQTTPLFTRSGRLVGMLSTHCCRLP